MTVFVAATGAPAMVQPRTSMPVALRSPLELPYDVRPETVLPSPPWMLRPWLLLPWVVEAVTLLLPELRIRMPTALPPDTVTWSMVLFPPFST